VDSKTYLKNFKGRRRRKHSSGANGCKQKCWEQYLIQKRIFKSDGRFQERDEAVSFHATGYIADPKEARESKEGFGHILSQVH